MSHEHDWKQCPCENCKRTPGLVFYCAVCNAEKHMPGSYNNVYWISDAEGNLERRPGTEPVIIGVNMPALEDRA